jgi:MATE family multidrug resistance protein
MDNPARQTEQLTQRAYLALVLPFILSTVTTPLMGAVDTAVVGHLPDPSYIGGVAIGAVIFSTMYWLFGFLRVSTSGFAAQAMGARDDEQLLWALVRPLAMAGVISSIFLILQEPILAGALSLIRPTEEVGAQVSLYFRILIWGAPFMLGYYVLLGWLMGMVRLKAVLFLQIAVNLLNMVLALWFVQVLHWGIAGVASATLIAQIISLVMAAGFVGRYSRFSWQAVTWKELTDRAALRRIVSVNGDLMLRTVCLLAMTNLFTRAGASLGTDVLAANAVLFQIQYIMAYFLDGFANASSVWAGKARGSRDEAMYRTIVSLSWRWSLYAAAGLAGIYWLGQGFFISLFTHLQAVLALCALYSPWMVLFPFCASVGLIFYGVFTGITQTAPIRNSTFLSLLVYLAAQALLVPLYGNHGLWLAFLLFTGGRSLFLAPYVLRTKGSTAVGGISSAP